MDNFVQNLRKKLTQPQQPMRIPQPVARQVNTFVNNLNNMNFQTKRPNPVQFQAPKLEMPKIQLPKFNAIGQSRPNIPQQRINPVDLLRQRGQQNIQLQQQRNNQFKIKLNEFKDAYSNPYSPTNNDTFTQQVGRFTGGSPVGATSGAVAAPAAMLGRKGLVKLAQQEGKYGKILRTINPYQGVKDVEGIFEIPIVQQGGKVVKRLNFNSINDAKKAMERLVVEEGQTALPIRELTRRVDDVVGLGIADMSKGRVSRNEIGRNIGTPSELARVIDNKPQSFPEAGISQENFPRSLTNRGIDQFQSSSQFQSQPQALPKGKLKGVRSEQPQLSSPQSISQSFEATPQTMQKVLAKKSKELESLARKEYTEWNKQFTKQVAPRTLTGAVDDLAGQIQTQTKSPMSKNIEQLKDISGFTGGTRDVYRNFKAVFGKNYDNVKRVVLDPFDKSKGTFIDDLNRLSGDLDKTIVKGLGIKKKSNESALVQKYGEKLISLEDLQKQTPNWQKIVKADEFFRRNYDQLLDEVNAVRARIYPNQPDKIIPKRNDYYRHFRELQDGFAGLQNIFDTPAQIGSKLSGTSEFVKPKSKFLSFAQKRLGAETEYDAVGGYLDYIRAQSYAKNIDPNISNFRNLADELATATADGPNAGKLNNFIEFLQDYANDLSGKTNPLDRTFQKWIPGGRKTFRAINWVNSRVKANAILGNLSSSVAQAANLPQGIASAGPKYTAKGVGKTLSEIFTKDKSLSQSTFLKERYFRTFDKFDRGMVGNTKRGAAWITQVLDEIGTKSIWNMHYEKAISEGIQNPVKYADDITRSLVAGRGIGEVPLMQKSKMFQLVAPFQLEVANLWWVMKDMVSEKQFGKIAALFIGNYLFNRAAEQVRGSDVTFDPIQATIEAFQEIEQSDDKKIGAFKAAGRLGGEVVSNVPLGQTLASVYPEYGFKVGDTQMPTREDFFGEGDPTRFGSGLLAAKGLQDPIFKVLPPFGGAQMKKLIEGKRTNDKGYSETKSGRIRFKTEDNTINNTKRLLFGQYAGSEARDYFKKERTPLGDKQSETFKQLPEADRDAYIKSIYMKRENDALIEQIKTKLEKGEDASGLISQVSAAEESTPANNKLLLEAQEDVAKSKVKIQGLAQKVGNKYFYLKEDGEAGTIDLTPPTKGNGIDAFTNKNWKYTKAREAWKSTLPEKQKEEIYKQLGTSRDDVRYDVLTTYNNDVKTQYILSKDMTHPQLLNRLIRGRVVSVSGDIFATDGVLKSLLDQGVITGSEYGTLKKLKLDKNGKSLVPVKAGGGSGKKVKYDYTGLASKLQSSPIKLKKTKLNKVKLGRSNSKSGGMLEGSNKYLKGFKNI